MANYQNIQEYRRKKRLKRIVRNLLLAAFIVILLFFFSFVCNNRLRPHFPQYVSAEQQFGPSVIIRLMRLVSAGSFRYPAFPPSEATKYWYLSGTKSFDVWHTSWYCV